MHADALFVGRDQNVRVLGRKQHAVIEFVRDRPRAVFQRDEIEDVVVVVERPIDFHGHAVVVPVQPFAFAAVVGDEMPGAEDEIVFGNADGVTLGGHIQRSMRNGESSGNWMIPVRKATNKEAATRSAVVPGLGTFSFGGGGYSPYLCS